MTDAPTADARSTRSTCPSGWATAEVDLDRRRRRSRTGHLVAGELDRPTGDDELPCDLLAVDEAYPAPVADDARPRRAPTRRGGTARCSSCASTAGSPSPSPAPRFTADLRPRRPRPARQGRRRLRPTHYAVRLRIGVDRPRRGRVSVGPATRRRDLRVARVAGTRARSRSSPTPPPARAGGRGRATPRWPGCARPGSRCATSRAATPTRRSTWPAQCVADGVDALVVVGGDGMVHLGVQAVADDRHRRWASSRPAPATTWPATSTCPARTRVAAAERVDRRPAPAPSTWPAAAPLLRHRAGRRLRRRRQRARQPDDLAARARCATTSPPWPSCAPSEPLPYTLELDGADASARGDAGRGRQRAVVRRRPADHRGRHARRRPARRRRSSSR